MDLEDLKEDIHLRNKNLWEQKKKLESSLEWLLETVRQYNPNNGPHQETCDILLGNIINSPFPISTGILLFTQSIKELQSAENTLNNTRQLMEYLDRNYTLSLKDEE